MLTAPRLSIASLAVCHALGGATFTYTSSKVKYPIKNFLRPLLEWEHHLLFSIKVNKKQRLAYIPQQIVRDFGFHLSFLPDSAAAIVYSANTNLELVIRSVEILLADLKLRQVIFHSEKLHGHGQVHRQESNT